MSFRQFNRHWQLRWTSVQLLTLSGIGATFFCRHLESFEALSVGWCASLSFQIYHSDLHRLNPNRQAGLGARVVRFLRFYLLLIPVLIPLGVPHPTTAFLRYLAYPILSVTTFALSALVFAYRPFDHWVGPVFDALAQFTQSFPNDWLPDSFAPLSLPPLFPLAYLAFLTFWAHLQERPQPCREFLCHSL